MKNTDGNKVLHYETLNATLLNTIPLNDYKKVCGSCIINIALFSAFFITGICISSVFIHFYWYIKKSSTNITSINPGTETTIY